MAIPDNFLFSLQDVADEMGLDDNIPPINSLAEAFQYANEYGFDQLYENLSDDTLREFRNYDHTAEAIVYTMFITANFDYTQVPWDGILLDARVYMNVNPDPNAIIASFSTNEDWITLTDFSNKTDGTYAGVAFSSQPSTSSPERSGRITLTYQSGGVVSSTSVFILVTQNAGPSYGGPIP